MAKRPTPSRKQLFVNISTEAKAKLAWVCERLKESMAQFVERVARRYFGNDMATQACWHSSENSWIDGGNVNLSHASRTAAAMAGAGMNFGTL
jgi:hypothetical protein